MRSSRFLIAVMALLAVPAGTYAKKPTPMPCPDDVAAALAAACPCDGQKQSDGSTLPYRNHGKYVSCVVCCQTAAGTCNDASPGNGLAEGVCSNEIDHACDTDADCVTSRAHITHD